MNNLSKDEIIKQLRDALVKISERCSNTDYEAAEELADEALAATENVQEDSGRHFTWYKFRADILAALGEPPDSEIDIVERTGRMASKAMALDEWYKKTNWVQEEINTFPLPTLGKHRADVMREEIMRLRNPEPISEEILRGAIARGWCAPANSHKEMDSDLANAIYDEVKAAIEREIKGEVK